MLLFFNFNLNDFFIVDWMEFVFNFVKEVNYFVKISDIMFFGDWKVFFVEKDNIVVFVLEIEKNNNFIFYFILFVVFLKFLEIM